MAKKLGRPVGKSGERLEVYLPKGVIEEARQLALDRGFVITQGRQKGQGNLSKLFVRLLQRESMLKRINGKQTKE